MEEAQREGRTWKEVRRLAATSWKTFAPTQETTGIKSNKSSKLGKGKQRIIN
jgi:hypothetical protein